MIVQTANRGRSTTTGGSLENFKPIRGEEVLLRSFLTDDTFSTGLLLWKKILSLFLSGGFPSLDWLAAAAVMVMAGRANVCRAENRFRNLIALIPAAVTRICATLSLYLFSVATFRRKCAYPDGMQQMIV